MLRATQIRLNLSSSCSDSSRLNGSDAGPTTDGSTGSDPQCRIVDCNSVKLNYLKLQITGAANEPDVANDVLCRTFAVFIAAIDGKTIIMTEHSLWPFSRALQRAINERNLEEVEPLIDEDVDWAIYGPIDMFPFLGARHGKAAVIDVIRQIAKSIKVHRFDREKVMLGVDTAASMLRLSLTALDANKPISVRVAHFAQFKAGRLRSIRVVVDTFDLVEQALGRPIHLPRLTSLA
jgi:ketosteroid isomerase-like protein